MRIGIFKGGREKQVLSPGRWKGHLANEIYHTVSDIQ